MKNIFLQFVFLCGIVLLFQSCYDNPTFLEKHTKKGKEGFYPVLNVTGNYKNQYSPGDTVKFVMEYFSQGEIDAITLDEQIVSPKGDTTSNQVFSKPASAGAFSKHQDLDTLAVSYKIPQVPESTRITLKNKVTNKNDLADSVAISFIVIRNP